MTFSQNARWRFIRDRNDRPFFLYAAYTVPHFAAEDEDADRFSVPSTEPYSRSRLG